MIYLNEIKDTFLDFPNDSDIAVIAFFEGCSHNCNGCQNKHLAKRKSANKRTWKFAYDSIKERCERNNTNKIVLSGGDPFFDANEEDLNDMLSLISSLESDGFEVCVYTGSSIDHVINIYNVYGKSVDAIPTGWGYEQKVEMRCFSPTYLKCGRYDDTQLNLDMGKSDNCFVLASRNQDFYKKVNDEFTYEKLSTNGVLIF